MKVPWSKAVLMAAPAAAFEETLLVPVGLQATVTGPNAALVASACAGGIPGIVPSPATISASPVPNGTP